jgi:hypothetical protein
MRQSKLSDELSYETKRMNRTHRLMKRARALHQRLGGDGGELLQSPSLLTKPKWKHYETWEREVCKWQQLDAMAFQALAQKWESRLSLGGRVF